VFLLYQLPFSVTFNLNITYEVTTEIKTLPTFSLLTTMVDEDCKGFLVDDDLIPTMVTLAVHVVELVRFPFLPSFFYNI